MNSGFDQILKSIKQLSALDQERILRWLEAKVPSNGDASQVDANRSAKSLRWLHENREKYAGQWVALDGDRLIASGPTAKEVYSKAKAEGVEIPFVELVTDQDQMPFTGGWLSLAKPSLSKRLTTTTHLNAESASRQSFITDESQLSVKPD